jgi:hypothetical protein
MMDSDTTTASKKVRVSIFERIVPFAAFGLAALAGGIGSYMIVYMFRTLAAAENAGKSAVSGGLAEMTLVPLILIYAGCALGVLGICIAIGRMVITTNTSSPSGFSYIVLGLLSLLPLAIVWRVGTITIDIVIGTSTNDAGLAGASIAEMCIAAMVSTPIILLLLLAWSLIPFRARPGRRFGPLIALVVTEIALVTVAVMYQLRLVELWRINAAS